MVGWDPGNAGASGNGFKHDMLLPRPAAATAQSVFRLEAHRRESVRDPRELCLCWVGSTVRTRRAAAAQVPLRFAWLRRAHAPRRSARPVAGRSCHVDDEEGSSRLRTGCGRRQRPRVPVAACYTEIPRPRDAGGHRQLRGALPLCFRGTSRTATTRRHAGGWAETVELIRADASIEESHSCRGATRCRLSTRSGRITTALKDDPHRARLRITDGCGGMAGARRCRTGGLAAQTCPGDRVRDPRQNHANESRMRASMPRSPASWRGGAAC